MAQSQQEGIKRIAYLVLEDLAASMSTIVFCFVLLKKSGLYIFNNLYGSKNTLSINSLRIAS